jgi:PAS domain S-box-containing protein
MTDIDSEPILIVDDEQDVALTLKESLECQGHRCLVAGTGREALRCLRTSTVALVLLDLGLPDMNGIDVMREALARGGPEILIMTGQASAESAMEAVEGSTAGYILKPIELARLARIVQRVLQNRRLARENARLQADMNQRLRETEAVLAISKACSSTLEVREGLRRVCRELTRFIGADTGAVYLHEPVSDHLIPQAGYHVPPGLLPTLLATPLPFKEQGFHAAIWRERRPILSDDVAADARFSHEMFRLFPHQSGLVLPLILDGEVAGAFYLVWWAERRRLTERELALVESVAEQATTLLRNVRLLEQAERERRRLDVLYEVSRRLAAARDSKSVLARLVDEASNLLGVEAAGIRLLDGDDLVLGARTVSAARIMARAKIKHGESLSGHVVARGESIQVSNLASDERFDPEHKRGALEEGFQAFLGVPLRLHDRVIGTLNVYTKRCRKFAPDEVSLLSALADQTSLAIYKARLYDETRLREREATQLYDVTSLLASSLDVDWVLDQISGKAVGLLGCDAFGIYMYDASRGGLTFRRGINLAVELTDNLVLKPGEGVAGRAFESGRAAWTRDRMNDPSLAYTPAADDLIRSKAPRAYLAVPVLIRGDVLGVLVSYFFAPHDFTENEIRLLTTLADHAGIAMDNARHYEDSRAQQQRLTQIFDSTSDGILLVDPDGSVGTANRRAEELLGRNGGTLVGSSLDEAIARAGSPDADRQKAEAALRRLAAATEQESRGDLELKATGRVLHWVAQRASTASGASMGFTLTLHDVTEERQVSQMKSDFVSFVTHQLRTPLAGIKWMLELASQEADLPAEAGSYVQDAQAAAQRLIGLVNDLLDISRLERGKLQMDPRPVALRSLTHDVLEENRLLAEAKGHRLDVARGTDAPVVAADPQLLRQVILNLVSNAIKYTPDGGKIEIEMRQADDEGRWQIRDSGVGVPASAQARLFEKFYRADNVTSMETEGTGLGLYLVRLIMEQLGGRVWCESVEGEGATFVFTLPRHAETT